LGIDGGEKKTEDAKKKNVKIIDEDGLFELITSRSEKLHGSAKKPKPASQKPLTEAKRKV